MAINYNIQASVVDITTDTPQTGDGFLVDSNVWFWLTYPAASLCAEQYQLTYYPDYMNKALSVNAKIFRSGLSLAELAHMIERTERDIYSQYVKPISLKEYRHNAPAERTRIVSNVQAAWSQVKTLAMSLDLTIDESVTEAALSQLQTAKMDGYDLFIRESMKNHSIVQVITDDGDFATIPGIQVFTANRNVINAGRSQRKLLSR